MHGSLLSEPKEQDILDEKSISSDDEFEFVISSKRNEQPAAKNQARNDSWLVNKKSKFDK